MSLKSEKDKAKQLQDKCQSVLNSLLRDEDNKYCVDCDSKGPRWASWNIGVFLCIRCAGIHRNLGVHISKVKSVNLDSWTPEQVVSLQQMGNSRARAVYEANLPDNFRRPQNDSSLESFIRAKYEHKKYIAREWVAPPLPKVNWEKEIDEEMEKQKRKKKTVLEKKQLANVEVPQLPKPTANPSPKPSRSTNTQESKDKQLKHTSNFKSKDLLGINNGEDQSFSSFISAPPATQNSGNGNQTVADATVSEKKQIESAIKSEEESFFNQSLPTEKEKVKLDKDSILALYGNTPTIPQYSHTYQAASTVGFQNASLPHTQQGNFTFGGFPSGVPAFSLQSQQFMVPQQPQQANGMFQNWSHSTPVQYQAQTHQNQLVPNTFGSTTSFVPTTTTFPTMMANNHPQQFGNVTTTQMAMGNSFVPTGNNAFYNNQSGSAAGPPTSLQQQFGNLSLGGPTAASPNIWH
ncbi:hypothetical protein ABEB36_003224 [Hypothenemus hampei]|uniref:Arf-GAP domain-containing protein n=1 Tax=Hypothenemus hampei TaxID=57062 RepID=A0ABD1FC40_HYPHA